MNKFDVGDTVIVTDYGYTYDTASQWVPTEYLDKYKERRLPKNDDVGVIVCIAQSFTNVSVYLVDIDNKMFLIGGSGLALHEKESTQISLSFSEIREKYAVLFSDPYFSIDMIGDHFEVNYGHEWCDCKTEEDLVSVLEALVVLKKFKHQGI